MGFLFGRKKTALPANAIFRITPEGEDKLQEYNGDQRSQILIALKTRGSSNIVEIAQATGLNRGTVEKLIPSLAPDAAILTCFLVVFGGFAVLAVDFAIPACAGAIIVFGPALFNKRG